MTTTWFIVLPFVLLCALCAPQAQPANWVQVREMPGGRASQGGGGGGGEWSVQLPQSLARWRVSAHSPASAANPPLPRCRWRLQVDWNAVQWGTYLNIMFWNLK